LGSLGLEAPGSKAFYFSFLGFENPTESLDKALPPQWTLRWGWVFLERTRILSGIQFTTHFNEIFVVETKRFVSSF